MNLITTLKTNMQRVFDVAFDKGKKAEYDAFWDAFQENGARTNYRNAFCSWKPECYKPKYPIIAVGRADAMFWQSKIKEIGVIDCAEATGISTVFYQCTALKTIEKLIVSELCTGYESGFTSCNKLENITIEGIIGAKISFSYSDKLSKASIESIINALSSTTSGLSVTFSKTAVNTAFGIDVADEATWTDEWKALKESKSNWTISFS